MLGVEETRRLRSVDPAAWYPIDWMLNLMAKLNHQIGHYGLVRMGRRLFEMSHQARARQSLKTARDIVYAMNAMYHNANREVSGIGGWSVVLFEPGYTELEKTTPHHCVMEQGISGRAQQGGILLETSRRAAVFGRAPTLASIRISSAVVDERWCSPDEK